MYSTNSLCKPVVDCTIYPTDVNQVTNSLAALARTLVYCTEPFRISYAGRLDTICFDKVRSTVCFVITACC
jgi:hypothetical protein